MLVYGRYNVNRDRTTAQIAGVSARPIVGGNPDFLAWIAAQTHETISV